jgi:uncharacterized BrkB/YihY/UPF0761 family membrane protein
MIPVMTLKQLSADLSHFPWRDTAITLRKRFREDNMGLTASSLTFTTTISLVPFFTVALAIFTAFPMFTKLQGSLQVWLIESLIPENISRQVLGYLTQFSLQASKLGVAGLAVLVVTAVAMILTIDRTFNGIWRVRNPRPFAQPFWRPVWRPVWRLRRICCPLPAMAWPGLLKYFSCCLMGWSLRLWRAVWRRFTTTCRTLM